MQASVLRQLWQRDQCAVGTFVTTPSSRIAEALAHQGYDTLLLDNQHGLIDLRTVQEMLNSLSSSPTVPIVRVSWNDPAEIMQCLDAGAAGVVCPMISDREEARRFVQACRYPPVGYRSFGPIRAKLIDPDGFANPLAFAMIETAGAVEHLEAIAATQGLDGLFVGPWDLSLSLGYAKEADFTDPKFLRLIERILQTCKSHGLVPGIFVARIEDARKVHAMGYRYIILSDDNVMLQERSSQLLRGVKDAIGE